MKLIELPVNAGHVLYVNPDQVAGVLPYPDPMNLTSGAILTQAE